MGKLNSDLAVAALLEDEKRDQQRQESSQSSQQPATLRNQFEMWSTPKPSSQSTFARSLIAAGIVVIMAFVIRPPFLCRRRSQYVHSRLSLARVFVLAAIAGTLTWVLERWLLSKP